MYAHRLSFDWGYTQVILKPTLTFDTIDRQQDRTKKLYRTLKEPLGTTKHSSEQSKDFILDTQKEGVPLFASKKLDEMGHLHLLLDEMGLDEMGLDEMGINLHEQSGTVPI